jgi:hypothetical protein
LGPFATFLAAGHGECEDDASQRRFFELLADVAIGTRESSFKNITQIGKFAIYYMCRELVTARA